MNTDNMPKFRLRRIGSGTLSALIWMASAGAAQDAALLYEEGLSAFQSGDLSGAGIHVKNAIKADPGQIAAHILLARIHLREGAPEQAEDQLALAEHLGASRQLTAVPLARAYLAQEKYLLLLDKIFPTYGAADTDAEILQLRGIAQFKLHDDAEALRSFEQAAEQAPQSAAPLLHKASVLTR